MKKSEPEETRASSKSSQSPKRILAAFLALLMCLGTLPWRSTVQAAEIGTYFETRLPASSDPNQSNWGYSTLNLMGGWTARTTRYLYAMALDRSDGQVAYCIEPGVNLLHGATLERRGEEYWDNYPAHLNATISPHQIKTFIGRTLMHGYTGNVNPDGTRKPPAIPTKLQTWWPPRRSSGRPPSVKGMGTSTWSRPRPEPVR